MPLVTYSPLVYVFKECSETVPVVGTNMMVCIQGGDACAFHSVVVSYDLHETLTEIR
jgi:hypothetical protein